MWNLLIPFHSLGSSVHFSFYFFLSVFQLSLLSILSIELNDFFSCSVYSVVKLIQWPFHCRYYIFQFQDFHLVLPYSFHLFAEILPFIHPFHPFLVSQSFTIFLKAVLKSVSANSNIWVICGSAFIAHFPLDHKSCCPASSYVIKFSFHTEH